MNVNDYVPVRCAYLFNTVTIHSQSTISLGIPYSLSLPPTNTVLSSSSLVSTCSSSVASIPLKSNGDRASLRSREGIAPMTLSNGLICSDGPSNSNKARRSSYPRGAQRRQHHVAMARQQPHIAAALLGAPMAKFPASLPKGGPGSDETITMIMVSWNDRGFTDLISVFLFGALS